MRVVSLVPSATETLLALGVTPVACTRFCEQPGIAVVGGTKNPDVEAIVSLEPELVVMNDEENRREDFDALRGAAVPVHSISPRSLEDVGPAVATLAEAIAVPAPPPFGVDEWPAWLEDQRHGGGRQSCVTLVWRRPWMTLAPDTYGASLLSFLGLDQIVLGGDDRYPEVTLDEIEAAGPDVVLLPSEPYVFRDKHAAEVAAEVPTAEVRLIDGRDLFWWGVRTQGAIARLVKALA